MDISTLCYHRSKWQWLASSGETAKSGQHLVVSLKDRLVQDLHHNTCLNSIAYYLNLFRQLLCAVLSSCPTALCDSNGDTCSMSSNQQKFQDQQRKKKYIRLNFSLWKYPLKTHDQVLKTHMITSTVSVELNKAILLCILCIIMWLLYVVLCIMWGGVVVVKQILHYSVNKRWLQIGCQGLLHFANLIAICTNLTSILIHKIIMLIKSRQCYQCHLKKKKNGPYLQ